MAVRFDSLDFCYWDYQKNNFYVSRTQTASGFNSTSGGDKNKVCRMRISWDDASELVWAYAAHS